VARTAVGEFGEVGTAVALGVAVIGAGMAGRGHAAAYRAASSLYASDLPEVKLVAIGDVNSAFGEAAAKRFGFERAETDWRTIADDPSIHAVSVVVANHLHREIVEGLLEAGKDVLCEKPLSDTVESAAAMVASAQRSGRTARLGLTFLKNPAIAAIRELVASGRLGKVQHFSGRYWCDYSLDPQAPMTWRYKGAMGTGALADIGSHITYLSEFIVGSPVTAVSGASFLTAISKRPLPSQATVGHEKVEVTEVYESVENDDYASLSVQFEEALGNLEVSRIAAGHPNTLTFEVFCENGAAAFDLRRNGEFQLLVDDAPQSESGFRTVLIGPSHPYISNGLPVDGRGVGVGQNDQWFFQNRAFLQEVAGLPETAALPFCPSFEDGVHNMQLIEAAVSSHANKGATVQVPPFTPSYVRRAV
jgi:predicted dehydrogenase